MKRLATLFIGFFAGAMTLAYSTQEQKHASPLMEPYMPTRLEWLALDLESRFKVEQPNDPVSSVDYVAVGPDTILVTVWYKANTPAGAVDLVIQTSQETVKKAALSYGWSKWIKIRVERHST